MRDYAVLIMTHGRADNVKTDKALRECGYTGKVYYIIDTDDEQGERYKEKYGADNVIEFDKKEYEAKMDTGDAGGSMKCVVFARNACYDIARRLGLPYFVEADDDYTTFSYRYEEDGQLKQLPIKSLNDCFGIMFDFLDESGATAVAPAQGGDFIGGIGGNVWKNKLVRKCMNLFFCKTDNPIDFVGRINEDVTSYAYYGSLGKLFFTHAEWMLNQAPTQKQAGGMTETYLESGTYLKSFYSVMWNPSCVKISAMGGGGAGHVHNRIHHQVEWDRCVPQILNEKWKRKGDHIASGKTEKGI